MHSLLLSLARLRHASFFRLAPPSGLSCFFTSALALPPLSSALTPSLPTRLLKLTQQIPHHSGSRPRDRTHISKHITCNIHQSAPFSLCKTNTTTPHTSLHSRPSHFTASLPRRLHRFSSCLPILLPLAALHIPAPPPCSCVVDPLPPKCCASHRSPSTSLDTALALSC